MLKQGGTKVEHFIRFLELLDQKLCDFFGNYYYKHTIFILDNAIIHCNTAAKRYYHKKKLRVMSLPQYSPELNPIELLFNEIKMKIRSKNLINKQFEWIVADVIQSLHKR
jgi:hypothetical protein